MQSPAGAIPEELFEVSLECALPGITIQEVGRVVGYTGSSMPAHFGDIISELLAELQQYCQVRAGYRIAAINRAADRGDGLDIGGTVFSLGRIISSQLRRAERAALFACTIGPYMEELAAALFQEGDPVKGHFVDTIASIAVERAADVLHDAIDGRMREQGLSVTNRFSPGYCGWPVAEQHALFGFFPAGFCGINVTESALMLPKKSVSGIIGIGPQAVREPYFCDRCTKKECTYRMFLSTRNKKDGTV